MSREKTSKTPDELRRENMQENATTAARVATGGFEGRVVALIVTETGEDEQGREFATGHQILFGPPELLPHQLLFVARQLGALSGKIIQDVENRLGQAAANLKKEEQIGISKDANSEVHADASQAGSENGTVVPDSKGQS